MNNNICAKCGYHWLSRKTNPVCCPRCKSYKWKDKQTDVINVRPDKPLMTDAKPIPSKGEYIDTVNESVDNELQYDFNSDDVC
jgi:uncharacterized Zn finger protein (UPF0148 family)